MEKSLCDKALLEAADEQAAFRILYERYWESLYQKAVTRLGNQADAEDTVQEVFISLWRNRKTIDVAESLSPYLFTAIRYSIIKKVYGNARLGIFTPLSAAQLEQQEISTPVNELLEYKELLSTVNRNVAELPVRMQQVYHLSRVERLPAIEIARELKLSEQTVRNTLTTALKKLRIKLSHLSAWILFLF